jgi:signal transduction histidine kinase
MFLDIVGMTRTEALAMTPDMFWADLNEREEMVQRIVADGRITKFECKILTKQGVVRNCLASATLYPEQGVVEGSIIDITEYKKLEEQLRQAQKMEAIGTLAGGVAHDFNNILMAIITFGAMARKRVKNDEKTKKFIDEILIGAERAAELTRGLLAFSRKQPIALKRVDLNDIVKKVNTMLVRVIGEDIKLTTHLLDGDLVVMADTAQIQQILLNLASNARDAMPDGGELIIQADMLNVDSSYAEAHLFETTGMYAVLTISDTGIGMDQKTMENIFEPFFTTKEIGKGTGLGLSMVYGTVKQHGGNINVYSELGKGTTFRIYLPMTTDTVEKEAVPVQSARLGNGEAILLAEDDPQVRKVTGMYLRGNGYEVIEAENGEEAVRRFLENKDKIAIVLLDVIMPIKAGKYAYEEIKKIAPDIKAIFMSGYTDDIISRKGILEEGFDFISKPMSPDTLLRKIREVLDR